MIASDILLLAIKMVVAASIVVSVSRLAERAGPFVAAMIATLPISIGPVYIFLALEHDAAFMAAGALGSMASNLGNAALCLVYVLLAQRHGVLLSLVPALCAWFATVASVRAIEPSFIMLMAATVLVFLGLHLGLGRFLSVKQALTPKRLWYAVPLRAACVALLAGAVTTISGQVGPGWSGVLAAFPVVLSSLIAILHGGIGGPATAAMIANGALGLLGFGLALGLVHVSAVPLGSALALTLGLALCIGWNLALMRLKNRPR